MTTEISMHDLVAIKEDIETSRFPFGGDIILPIGLVGTVVDKYAEGKAFAVEFAGNDGEAYALVSIEVNKLFLLHFDYQPTKVAVA